MCDVVAAVYSFRESDLVLLYAEVYAIKWGRLETNQMILNKSRFRYQTDN